MNLYNLTGTYKELEDMLNDENVDLELISDTLESIDGEIEDKANNYAKIIRDLEANIEARKKEEARLAEGRKTLENRVKWLKNNLYENMKILNKTKFSTDLFSFNIAKNGGKRAVEITGEVPDFYTLTTRTYDLEKIRGALEALENNDNGKESLDFARLKERGETLRIK